ncbi:unnamed protein product [Protopolystoma xenopodis]|uniref:Uncharacterized protein n=1 Tax=Protopolystoma xenopodis TaxID=117903 RepID=A0A3S5B8H0_9PLAT|nr:unnamed protein product [Protopolystoma xenopodis]
MSSSSDDVLHRLHECSACLPPKRGRMSCALRQPERRIKTKRLQYNRIQPSSLVKDSATHNLQVSQTQSTLVSTTQSLLDLQNKLTSLTTSFEIGLSDTRNKADSTDSELRHLVSQLDQLTVNQGLLRQQQLKDTQRLDAIKHSTDALNLAIGSEAFDFLNHSVLDELTKSAALQANELSQLRDRLAQMSQAEAQARIFWQQEWMVERDKLVQSANSFSAILEDDRNRTLKKARRMKSYF